MLEFLTIFSHCMSFITLHNAIFYCFSTMHNTILLSHHFHLHYYFYLFKYLTSTLNSLDVKHFWVMIMVKGLHSDRNLFNTQAINKLPLIFITTTLVSKENHIILKPAVVWLMHLVKFFFLQWCSFSMIWTSSQSNMYSFPSTHGQS